MRYLLLIVLLLAGCAPQSTVRGTLDVTSYYLSVGEPAPVEGPQFSWKDYVKIRNELKRLWIMELENIP